MHNLVDYDNPAPLKVISGMQTGVDQAGLFAAEHVGLTTGGYAPKNFRTTAGNCPELGKRFGIKETEIYEYTYRTELNVIKSDGTIQLAFDFDSPGERLTTRLIAKHNKPVCTVLVGKLKGEYNIPEHYLMKVDEFLKSQNIRTLNVAGNGERTTPGITRPALEFFIIAFEKWKSYETIL